MAQPGVAGSRAGNAAQAVLFTIALGSGDRFLRVVASLLSLVMTFLCLTLVARHRQAELTDAVRLAGIRFGTHPRCTGARPPELARPASRRRHRGWPNRQAGP